MNIYYIEFNQNDISLYANGTSNTIFVHHGNLDRVEKAAWIAFDNILFNLSEYVMKAFKAHSDQELLEKIREFNSNCCKNSRNPVHKVVEMNNVLYDTLYGEEFSIFRENLLTGLRVAGNANVVAHTINKSGHEYLFSYEYVFTFEHCHTIITNDMHLEYHEPFEIPYINRYCVNSDEFVSKLKTPSI